MYKHYDNVLIDAITKSNFDLENFDLLAVTFDNNKNGSYYVYKAPRSMQVQEKDYVLVPVKNYSTFAVVRIYAMNSNIQYANCIDTEAFAKSLLNEKLPVREVIEFLGNEEDGMIGKYYKKQKIEERKLEIIEKLANRAEEAGKLLIYKHLAESDNIMKQLLEELEDLKELN